MKPKVLIFIDWFSPGYKAGGPTTSNVNLVNQLKDLVDFYVITLDADYNDNIPYKTIQSNCWNEVNGVKIYYFSKDKISFSNLKKVIVSINCPVWYINGIYSKYFSIYPLVIGKIFKPSRIIVSARGMLSPHALALKSSSKKLFLSFARLIGLYKNILFHGTTPKECEDIKSAISTNCQTVSIPNLPRKNTNGLKHPKKLNGELHLISFARISPEKNTLFAIKALSSCKAKIRYDIYGQINSQAYWDECLEAIRNSPSNVTINYCGCASPNEIEKLYESVHVMYLPTTGENYGHAIVESIINGRPVIISTNTPWKNLKEKGIGIDIPLEKVDSYGEFIDKYALMDSDKFNNVCEKVYKYGESISNLKEENNKYLKIFTT